MKTQDWIERARKVTPGKQSNLKRGIGRVRPLVLDRADGMRYWDADGREYLDFMLGIGPAIHGHNHPFINAAIERQLHRLAVTNSSQAHTATEIELAEQVAKYVPCADMVRFAVTGTEANQAAIRLARAFTNRPYFLRFDAHYHGSLDNVFCGHSSDDPVNQPFAVESELDSAGLAQDATKQSYEVPWNNIEMFEALVDSHSDSIAMVMMEPVLCNYGCCPPKPGFLERVRELCTQKGIVLCFDEVVTGFRMGLGGAQAALGVTPDLAVFGKALGGGMPLAAIAGRQDIMNLLREDIVLVGGTFNSFPLGMAAGLATIELFERDGGALYSQIDAVQSKLMQGIKALGVKHGVPLLVQGPRGVFHVAVNSSAEVYDPGLLANPFDGPTAVLRGRFVDAGVLTAPGNRFFISSVMTESDAEETLRLLDPVIADIDPAG